MAWHGRSVARMRPVMCAAAVESGLAMNIRPAASPSDLQAVAKLRAEAYYEVGLCKEVRPC